VDAFPNGQPNEPDRILYELVSAAIATNGLEPFEYEFVQGFPLVWMYHRGLCAGAMKVEYWYLRYLDQHGYIDVKPAAPGRSGRLILTPQGYARYADLDLLRESRVSDAVASTPGPSVRHADLFS
jgi:hypothetical protein